jgi:hypothetical protein
VSVPSALPTAYDAVGWFRWCRHPDSLVHAKTREGLTRFGAPSRHTATGKQSQVLAAAVNRHMPATPAWGNQPRIKDANEVTILMRQLTRSTKEHGQGAQASTGG